MSSSINKAVLLGNLGKDPEVHTMQSGDKVCNLTVATSESWKDKNSGEKKERTEWHRVVIFNQGLAGVAEKYLSKGSKVYLEGEIRTRKYTDKDGSERFTTEIVLQKFGGVLIMLSGRGEAVAQDAQESQSYTAPAQVTAPDNIDTDIPF
jgi:single-strand DNA-binding protein